MDKLSDALMHHAHDWLTAGSLAGLALAGLAWLLAWIAGRMVSRARPSSFGAEAGLAREAALIVTPYLTALIVIATGRAALAVTDLDAHLPNLLLQLLGALITIRAAAFLLRLSVGLEHPADLIADLAQARG